MPGSPDLEKGRVACFPGTLQTVFASGHHLLPGLLLPCPTAAPPPEEPPSSHGCCHRAAPQAGLGASDKPGPTPNVPIQPFWVGTQVLLCFLNNFVEILHLS